MYARNAFHHYRYEPYPKILFLDEPTIGLDPPLQNAPKLLDLIARVDPLSYGVDGLRAALTGMTQFGYTTDIAVLAAVSALFIALGSWLFSKIQV